jgi:hypothetical protein
MAWLLLEELCPATKVSSSVTHVSAIIVCTHSGDADRRRGRQREGRRQTERRRINVNQLQSRIKCFAVISTSSRRYPPWELFSRNSVNACRYILMSVECCGRAKYCDFAANLDSMTLGCSRDPSSLWICQEGKATDLLFQYSLDTANGTETLPSSCVSLLRITFFVRSKLHTRAFATCTSTCPSWHCMHLDFVISLERHK